MKTPLIVALTLALAGCGGSDAGSASKSPAVGDSAAAPSIRIQDFGYHPSPLTVAPGQTVTITNLDGSEHTVTSDKSGAFAVDDISKGKAFTFTAPTTPGTYTFHCAYHASMHGTLVVKPAG